MFEVVRRPSQGGWLSGRGWSISVARCLPNNINKILIGWAQSGLNSLATAIILRQMAREFNFEQNGLIHSL